MGATVAGLTGLVLKRTIKHHDWTQAEIERLSSSSVKTDERLKALEEDCDDVKELLGELREERGEQREAHRGIAETLTEIKEALKDRC